MNTLDIPKIVFDPGDTDEVQYIVGVIHSFVDGKESRPYTLEEIAGMRVRPIGFVR